MVRNVAAGHGLAYVLRGRIGCLLQGARDLAGLISSAVTREASSLSGGGSRDGQRLSSHDKGDAGLIHPLKRHHLKRGDIAIDQRLPARERLPPAFQWRIRVPSSGGGGGRDRGSSGRELRVPEEDVDGPLLTFKLTRCSSLRELETLADLRSPVMNPIHIAALASRVGCH